MPVLLTHLPNELLEAIVAALCGTHSDYPIDIPGCTDRTYGPGCTDRTYGRCPPCDEARYVGLKSLCLTSRRFYNIAHLHIYHHVSLSNDWWNPLRKFATQPDLARSVRSLCWANVNNNPVSNGVIYKDIQRNKRLVHSLYAVLKKYGTRWSLSKSKRDALRPFISPRSGLTIELLTALLPNLETLVAEVHPRTGFQFCTPGSLPRLRRIHLRCYSVDKIDPRIAMRCYKGLFAAARDSLETVVLDMCCVKTRICPFRWLEYKTEGRGQVERESGWQEDEEGHEITLTRVTHLTIVNWILESGPLCGLLASFPNVTHMHITILGPAIPERIPSPRIPEERFWRYMQEPLPRITAIFRSLDRAPKLQSLVLEVGATFNGWIRWWNETDAREFETEMEARGVRVQFRHPALRTVVNTMVARPGKRSAILTWPKIGLFIP
jgi:hypothetical protein